MNDLGVLNGRAALEKEVFYGYCKEVSGFVIVNSEGSCCRSIRHTDGTLWSKEELKEIESICQDCSHEPLVRDLVICKCGMFVSLGCKKHICMNS